MRVLRHRQSDLVGRVMDQKCARCGCEPCGPVIDCEAAVRRWLLSAVLTRSKADRKAKVRNLIGPNDRPPQQHRQQNDQQYGSCASWTFLDSAVHCRGQNADGKSCETQHCEGSEEKAERSRQLAKK